MRQPREFVNEMQDDARFLPAGYTLAMVVEDQDCLHFLHHNEENLASRLSKLMKNGCIPLGLIRASPAEVHLTRTFLTVQKICGYKCFTELERSEEKNKTLLDAAVESARESFNKIRSDRNNKWVILATDKNPDRRGDRYVEIAIYRTDREDFIPPGKQPDKPSGPRLTDME
jgi:hypothetical protein